MDEFIERFKRWLGQEKEEGNIADWGLIEMRDWGLIEMRDWGVGVEVGEEEFFVTVEPA